MATSTDVCKALEEAVGPVYTLPDGTIMYQRVNSRPDINPLEILKACTTQPSRTVLTLCINGKQCIATVERYSEAPRELEERWCGKLYIQVLSRSDALELDAALKVNSMRPSERYTHSMMSASSNAREYPQEQVIQNRVRMTEEVNGILKEPTCWTTTSPQQATDCNSQELRKQLKFIDSREAFYKISQHSSPLSLLNERITTNSLSNYTADNSDKKILNTATPKFIVREGGRNYVPPPRKCYVCSSANIPSFQCLKFASPPVKVPPLIDLTQSSPEKEKRALSIGFSDSTLDVPNCKTNARVHKKSNSINFTSFSPSNAVFFLNPSPELLPSITNFPQSNLPNKTKKVSIQSVITDSLKPKNLAKSNCLEHPLGGQSSNKLVVNEGISSAFTPIIFQSVSEKASFSEYFTPSRNFQKNVQISKQPTVHIVSLASIETRAMTSDKLKNANETDAMKPIINDVQLNSSLLQPGSRSPDHHFLVQQTPNLADPLGLNLNPITIRMQSDSNYDGTFEIPLPSSFPDNHILDNNTVVGSLETPRHCYEYDGTAETDTSITPLHSLEFFQEESQLASWPCVEAMLGAR